jgi:hypothetical protein
LRFELKSNAEVYLVLLQPSCRLAKGVAVTCLVLQLVSPSCRLAKGDVNCLTLPSCCSAKGKYALPVFSFRGISDSVERVRAKCLALDEA